MSILDKGYLDTEAEEKREFILNSYHKIFSFYTTIIEDAHSLLNKSYSMINNSADRLIMVSLFMRSLTLYQAIYFIAQRGMLAESRILLRSLIETVFYLAAASNESSIFQVLQIKDEKQKLKSVNRIINSKIKINNLPSPAELDKIKQDIEQRIEVISAQNKSIEELSKIAKMHDYYLTVYSHLCNSVHTNLIDLEAHIVYKKDKLIGLSYGPTDDKLKLNLNTAIEVILNSMQAIDKYFKLGSENDIDNRHLELKSFNLSV